jgi:hypothetical protein
MLFGATCCKTRGWPNCELNDGVEGGGSLLWLEDGRGKAECDDWKRKLEDEERLVQHKRSYEPVVFRP